MPDSPDVGMLLLVLQTLRLLNLPGKGQLYRHLHRARCGARFKTLIKGELCLLR